VKYPNFFGAVHEYLGVLFMVSAPDEVVVNTGDLVRVEEGASFRWYFVKERIEDDHLEYYLVRPASLWERLFGGSHGRRSNPSH
jgi:hypothetical protein